MNRKANLNGRIDVDRLLPQVKKAVAGDQGEIENLIKEINGYVIRRVRSLTANSNSTEDIAQELLIKLFRNIRTLREPRKFIGWLEKMMRNQIYDFRKKRKVTASIKETKHTVAVNPGQQSNIERTEQFRLLKKLMKNLTPREQTAFYMREYEELSGKEIAKLMNIKPATARVLYARAGKKLIEMIARDKKGSV